MNSKWLCALAMIFALGACSKDETAPVAPAEPGPPASPHARVRFKGPDRLKLELARILEIEPDELCNELGLYDCFMVHDVALGGTDPFGVALYSPTETSTATTPLAVERVVLGSCIERAVRDLSAPANAVIFKNLAVDGAGKLDVQSEPVALAVDALYTRAMQRHAKPHEVTHLRSLYTQIEASAEAVKPAQEWAALGCFAVLTTLETLFY
jgi:hypothetical protein